MGTWRAVKVVYRSRFDSDRTYERDFEGVRRFEPVSHLHPSQLTVLHVGRNDAAGCFYYVMELADDAGGSGGHGVGQDTPRCSDFATNSIPTAHPRGTRQLDPGTYAPLTLRHKLEQRGRLPFRDCLETSLALTLALAHLHKHDLVHRDIKPSNIVFVDGLPKLADIGLVTAAGAHTFVGTEGYLPPEGPGTPAADLFSLGRVMYEMMTGLDRTEFPQLPPSFQNFEDHEQLVELNKVILRAAADDAGSRYESAEQLHEDLVAVQARKHVLDLRALARRSKGLKIAAWGLGAAAAVLGILALTQSRVARTERRTTLIHEAERLRLGERGDDWRDRSLSFLRRAGDMRLDDEVRGQATAVLAGTQARTRFVFKGTAATHLAFDATGQRLVLDGGGESGPVLQPLSVQDFDDLAAFARKLQHPADPVTAYLASRLSATTRLGLATYPGSGQPASGLQQSLLDDLKRVVNGDSIFDGQCFAGAILRSETQDLIQQHPRGAQLVSLNRMLLEDAYPLEISRKRRACVWDLRTWQCHEFASTNVGPVWFSPEGRPRQFVHLGGGLLAILNLEDNRVTQRLSLLSEATRRESSPSEGQALRGPDGGQPPSQAGDSQSSSLRNQSMAAARRLGSEEFSPSPQLVTLAVSPDGSLCAASAAIGASREFGLWETSSGRRLGCMDRFFCALAFSAGNDCLATGGPNGEVNVWSVPGLDQIGIRNHQGRLRIHCLAFGRDPAQVAEPRHQHPWLLLAGDAGGVINLYEVETGKLRRTFPGSQFTVRSLALSPDGMTFASGGRSSVRLWDIATGQAKAMIGFDRAMALAFAPDGVTLAAGMASTAGGHAKSQVIEVMGGLGVRTLGGLSAPCVKVVFSRDERWLAALAHNWEVAIWDTAGNRLERLLTLPAGGLADNAALAFSPDGGELVFTTHGIAGAWDRESGRCNTLWTNLPAGLAQQLAYHDAGLLLHFQWDLPESAAANGICRVRDLHAKDPMLPIADFAQSRQIFCSALSSDGKRVVVCVAGGKPEEGVHRLEVYDPIVGRLLCRLPSENPTGSDFFALDASGSVLAYQDYSSGRMRVYAIPDGQLKEESSSFLRALSPKAYWRVADRRDATGPDSGFELRRAGDRNRRLVLGMGSISPVQAFSQTGRYLAWGTDHGAVFLCDIQETIGQLEEQKLGWRGRH